MADTVEELKRQLQMALAQNEKLKQENSQLKKSHDQDVSNMQGRINTLLADKLRNEDRIAKLTSDNQKLTIHKHNMETVHINILRTIEENSIVYNRLLKRIPFPAVDDYIGLENYYQNIVSTLTRCYATLQYHQTRSLGLGTSEKTHGRNEEEPDEDDANAIAAGKKELQSECEVTASTPDDHDIEDEFTDDTLNEGIEVTSNKAPVEKAKVQATNTQAQEVTLDFLRDELTNKHSQDTFELLENSHKLLEKTSLSCSRRDGEVQHDRARQKLYRLDDSTEIVGIIKLPDGFELKMKCPHCRSFQKFLIKQSPDRYNTCVTPCNGRMELKTLLSPVYTITCPECGESSQLNSACITNFEIIEKIHKQEERKGQGNPQKEGSTALEKNKTALDCALSEVCEGERKTKERTMSPLRQTENTEMTDASEQKQRRAEYKTIKNDTYAAHSYCTLKDILIRDRNDNEVISPVLFNSEAFSFSPLFLKSKASTGLIVSIATFFSQLGIPKNRVYNFFYGKGLPFSREHMIGLLNGTARAYFHPIAEAIREIIVKNSVSVIMDESRLQIRENAKGSADKSKKSWIWVINSAFGAKHKATYYTATPGRNSDTVVDLLKDASSTLKYLTSDGYAGYAKAKKELEKLGVNIKTSKCLAHGRRELWYYLKDSGLLDIYEKYLLPKGSSFSDFKENLQNYLRKPKDRVLRSKERDLLIIFYLINALFVIDSSVICKHNFVCNTREFKAELGDVRAKVSKTVANALFDAVKLYIINHPKVVKAQYSKDGTKVRILRNNNAEESKALLYLFKFESELKRFVESPEIELTSNRSERAVKLAIMARKSFMFLNTVDSSHAFTDCLTITANCLNNGIPVYDYIIWLIANMKYRLSLLDEQNPDDDAFKLPGRKKSKDGGSTLNMYDPDNKCCYDKIDISGLTPFDYKELVLSHLQ